MQQRKGGIEHIQDILDLVKPKAVRKALGSFKPSASTGLDFVQLSKLKKAPDAVIASLSEVLVSMLVNLIGLDDCTVKLHLIAKKLAGFRAFALSPAF